jgi:C4-type Zn-finger protein
MGDRTITIGKCPKCGKDMEWYDAPSSMMYGGMCDSCGYRDPQDYYYTDDTGNNITLCTKEKAEEMDILKFNA